MPIKWAAATVISFLLVTLGAVSASATTNTISIGSPIPLSDRLLLSVPVTIVCDPLPNTPFQSIIRVTVQQADGQSVSTGAATEFASPPDLTCDGATQNMVIVKVTPDPGSGPFHGGGAIASASFQYLTGESCGGGCFFNILSENGSTGPEPVLLR